MTRYVFRDVVLGFKNSHKADAQVIGETIAGIAVERGGEVTPNDLVDAARPDDHPLHRHFEWDDSAAADAYRLSQARAIIRCVSVERADDEAGHVQAFVSVSGDLQRSYRPMEAVLLSKDLRSRVLESAQRDLDAFKKRYRELTDVVEVVAEASKKVEKRLKESHAAAA